jgi:hypothetical protein
MPPKETLLRDRPLGRLGQLPRLFKVDVSIREATFGQRQVAEHAVQSGIAGRILMGLLKQHASLIGFLRFQ